MGRMTVKECKDAVLKLINQYSIAGGTVALSYNNQADYIARMIPLINDAQMEIAKTVRRIPAQFEIVQNPVRNLYRGEAITLHGNADVVCNATSEPARSYYFEVDGVSTVYVEELVDGEWGVAAIHNITPDKIGFVPVKGLLKEGTGKVRFRLSGKYPYTFWRGAFYAYDYPSVDAVPVFSEFLEYSMPDDYYQLNGRGVPYYGDEFVMSHDFRWRSDRVLMLRRNLVGQFLVDYFRYPIRLADNVADNVELDNEPDTHEAIPYFVAAMLCQQDNPSLSATLYNVFETRISRLNEATFTENLEVEDVYGFNAGMGWG